jgi:chromosome segregation ATPase
MSQIETLMLVGLGFAAALLFALVVGRFAWATAQRFAKKRKNQQVPSTVLELQTDRDRLRAEHAMISRKLELRLDDLKSRLVEQMAEVSRNRNRIHKMAGDLERQTALVAERDAEVAALAAQKSALEDDLLARTGNLQAAREKLAALETEAAALRQSAADRDVQLAELRADLAGVPAIAPELAGLPAEERLRRRIANLSALSGEIAEQRSRIREERGAFGNVQALPVNAASLAAKLEAAERDADDLSDELRKLDQTWTAQLQKSAPPPPPPDVEEPATERQRGLANVISLAQRIRALKQDLG